MRCRCYRQALERLQRKCYGGAIAGTLVGSPTCYSLKMLRLPPLPPTHEETALGSRHEPGAPRGKRAYFVFHVYPTLRTCATSSGRGGGAVLPPRTFVIRRRRRAFVAAGTWLSAVCIRVAILAVAANANAVLGFFRESTSVCRRIQQAVAFSKWGTFVCVVQPC